MVDQSNGEIVALEKPYMLDEVITASEKNNKMDDELQIRSQPDMNDHISALEMPILGKGHY